jgi:hypothetical protein
LTTPKRSQRDTSTRLLGSKAWIGLFALGTAAISAVEMVLIELSSAFLTTGYNGVLLDSFPLIASFVLAAAVMDLLALVTLSVLLIPLLQRIGLSSARLFAVTAIVILGLPLGADVLRFEILARVGDLVSFGVVKELLGNDLSALSDAVALNAGMVALGVSVVVLGSAAVVAAMGRLAARLDDPKAIFEPPKVRLLASAVPILALISVCLLSGSSDLLVQIRSGLDGKLSVMVLRNFTNWATDIDDDGYGLLARIPDPDPFDSRINPHALDVPGNGIDENRLAGDHPVGYSRGSVITEVGFRGERKPHFLLVYLESFGTNLLGRRVKGREITPFLNRLKQEGAHSERFYAHAPSTVRSRAQLFGGTVAPWRGQHSLLDDFKDRGYYVAYFSGQDDSFGRGDEFLSIERADIFYDARQDIESRTSRSTHSASLQISWKLLLRRVREFLETHDPSTPTFLYVNFVDTHFPYHHAELDSILDIDPVDHHEIRSSNAPRVWETFANAAAGVDRAVEELVQSWRQLLGDAEHAIIVTADHGQAFYESGFLGHGRALDSVQTQVPLIVWGMGGEWPEPLGPADLRGLILRNLGAHRGTQVPRVRFRPDPGRRVVQYMPGIEHPVLFGIRDLEKAVTYDFSRGQLHVFDSADRRLEEGAQERDMDLKATIWEWEALRLEQEARTQSGGS